MIKFLIYHHDMSGISSLLFPVFPTQMSVSVVHINTEDPMYINKRK